MNRNVLSISNPEEDLASVGIYQGKKAHLYVTAHLLGL